MLKPEVSLPVGVGVATMVYAIHAAATPSRADIRTLPEGNADVDSAERTASWLSAAMVAGISLVARDPVILWFGCGAIVGMAWWTRHANAVVPSLGLAITPSERAAGAAVQPDVQMMATQPTDIYADQYQAA